MMLVFEWIVWSILAFITLFIGITWFIKEKKYPTGKMYDTNVVVTLVALPRIVFWEAVILITFLFININKLNLIWIYPLVYFVISVKWAKHIDRKDSIRNKNQENS